MKIDVEILCTACKRGWMESGRVEDGHMNHTVAVCEACAKEALAARDKENADLRAEVQSWRNVIAVICRDGGHYHQEHCTEATAAYCEQVVCGLRSERDALQQRCKRLEKAASDALCILDHIGSSAPDTSVCGCDESVGWICQFHEAQDRARDIRAALTPTETPGK